MGDVATSAQVKTLWLKAFAWKPQLSVTEEAMSLSLRIYCPAVFKFLVTAAIGTITGSETSTTVTVAVPVAEFPAWSVTFNVTVETPMFAQVKTVLLRLMTRFTGRVVSSKDPLSISAGVIVYEVPLRLMTMFFVTTVGGVVSAAELDVTRRARMHTRGWGCIFVWVKSLC